MKLAASIAGLGVCFMLIALATVGFDCYGKSKNPVPIGISTVEHEGHSYVVCRTWQGVAIVHCPDCCKKGC